MLAALAQLYISDVFNPMYNICYLCSIVQALFLCMYRLADLI